MVLSKPGGPIWKVRGHSHLNKLLLLPDNDDNKNHGEHYCHDDSNKIVDFFFEQGEAGVRRAGEFRKLMTEMVSVYFNLLQSLC